MANRLEAINPAILDAQLPAPAPGGTLEWGFVFKTMQRTFVQVDNFDFSPGDHYLRVPVVLRVRLDPAVPPQAILPDHAGHFTVAAADGATLCYADLMRSGGVNWEAGFRLGGERVGRARGIVSAETPSQYIEAALVAMVRRVTEKNG